MIANCLTLMMGSCFHPQSGNFRQTLGAYMTCTGMSTNGVAIRTRRTQDLYQRAIAVYRKVKAEFTAVVAGLVWLPFADQPLVTRLAPQIEVACLDSELYCPQRTMRVRLPLLWQINICSCMRTYAKPLGPRFTPEDQVCRE